MNVSRAACLIGWPAAHSRSPIIHKYWLETLGITGDYRIEAVPPDAVADFVAQLAARGYAGANVTIPYKERMLALTSPDERVQAVGAANTLWFDAGVLRSTNTDIEGFLGNLDACATGWDGDASRAHALVLGAGGSSRAVIFGLLERGFTRVYVANRTLMRAQELADRFGDNIRALEWRAIDEVMPNVQMLVNTTSLGMTGQPPLAIHIGLLPQTAVVADLVYVPLMTPLLKAAASRGLRTADGLGMLLHQAVRGFELWFGQRPQVTSALRALVENDLALTRT
jgi:shikimate dehydrogenase